MAAIKPKILLLGRIVWAHDAWTALGSKAELITATSANRNEFFADLKTKYSDIFGIYRTFDSVSATGRFDAELAENLPKSVKCICHNGAGYDQIDIQPFSARGIQVSNVPGKVDAATADTHLFLLLGALRNFPKGTAQLKKGEWKRNVPVGHDPEGKILGILGMGGIGRAVRDRCIPLGFSKIIYYNRHRLSPELEKDAEYVQLDDLLTQSDVISINVPLNAATRHLIDSAAIAKMKDGVVIINTARGAVIDEEALVAGLKSGKIRNVGLDVFEHEPEVHPELLNNDSVCIVPHLGTHTVETQKHMEEHVIANLENCIDTGKVLTIVPEQVGKF